MSAPSNSLSRRRFVEHTAKSLLGVSVLPWFAGNALAAPARKVDNTKLPGFGSADACIYLYMAGGMSHLDTFDPKPGAQEMGPMGTIKTNVPGEPLAATLPNLAKHRDKIAVVRSLSQKTGDHQQGSYIMRTSYNPRPDIRHPSMGPWAQELLGKRSESLPDSVVISAGSDHPLRGFLSPATSPLPILNPSNGVPFSQPFGSHRKPEVVESEYERRLKLLNDLDETFRDKFVHRDVKAYTQLYDEALRFMKSEELDIFDLSQESEAKRKRYGEQSSFGQGCLLATRLVKAGIRFVEVQSGGWDTHTDNFSRVNELAADMDLAVS